MVMISPPLTLFDPATAGAVAGALNSAIAQDIGGDLIAGTILINTITGVISGVMVDGVFRVSAKFVVASSRVPQLFNPEGRLIALTSAEGSTATAGSAAK